MGEVYRARDTRLDREVALKILPTDLAQDAARQARFHQEARAAGALNHPSIVAVYDIGREGDLSYIVTELVTGESLREQSSRMGGTWSS
jgi:serine/threonine protein kinase